MTATIPEDAMAEWSDGRLDEFALRMDERFDHLEGKKDERFERVNERFDGVDREFGRVNGRLDRIDSGLEKLQHAMVFGGIAMSAMMFAGFGALITLFAVRF